MKDWFDDEQVLAELKNPPILCKGNWTYSSNGDDFDCDYEHADFPCENCCVNGGSMDPRTGRKFRRRSKKKG